MGTCEDVLGYVSSKLVLLSTKIETGFVNPHRYSIFVPPPLRRVLPTACIHTLDPPLHLTEEIEQFERAEDGNIAMGISLNQAGAPPQAKLYSSTDSDDLLVRALSVFHWAD